MAARKMVASERLLQRVIISQNGDMMTGIRELIQNSFDSYYKFDTENKRIEFSFSGRDNITGFYHTMTCRDYGKTLGSTEDEVFGNFFIFGDSDKSDEEIGEFGIGRGQTIAMIYNPDNLKLEGEHTIISGNFVIKDINIEELTADIYHDPERVEGTMWTMTSLVPKFDKDEIAKFIYNKYRGEIPVLVDDEVVSKVIDKENSNDGEYYSTPAADIWIEFNKDYSSSIDVYDRGFFVCYKPVISGWGGTIVTKEALKLNFARNEIFDTETWRRIQDFIRRTILTKIKTEDFSGCCREKKHGLAKLYVKSVDDRPALDNFPLVELANGKWITPTTMLECREYYIASKGSVLAIEGIARGKIVINRDSPMVEFIRSIVKEVIDFSSSELAKEIAQNTFREGVPSIKEREALAFLNKIFVVPGITFREILLGEYADEKMLGWTIPQDAVIFINQSTLRSWLHMTQLHRVPLRAIPLLAHEYSHSEDNREMDEHGYAFDEKMAQMFKELIRVYDEYLDQSTFGRIHSPHSCLLLESIREKLNKNNETTPGDILTDEIIYKIVEEGGDPEIVYSNLMVSLAMHKLIDEEKLDQEGIIKIKRKDLLFNED
jgi:hypothetical protein